jgi:hypothetical protein
MIQLKLAIGLFVMVLLGCFANKTAFGQVTSEAKLHVTDLINNYGSSDYKIYATYGDKISPGDLKRHFDINGKDLSRILIIERCSNSVALCIR